MSLENCLQDLSGYVHWIAHSNRSIAQCSSYEDFCKIVDQECLKTMLGQRDNMAAYLLERSPKMKLYLQYQETAEENTKKYKGSRNNGNVGAQILADEGRMMVDAVMFPHNCDCPEDPALYAMVLAYKSVVDDRFHCGLGHADYLVKKTDDRLMQLLQNSPEIAPNMHHYVKIFLSIGLWMRDYPGFRQMVWNSRASASKENLRVGDENSKMVIEKLTHASRRKKGLCIYCGGTFKGLFKKVCSSCGRPKNY